MGVDKSSVSHAVCDAKAKGRMFFECGKPHKRCVTIMKANVQSDNEKDEICNLQSFAYNANGKMNKNTQFTQNTQCDNSCEPYIVPTTIVENLSSMQVHTHLQAASLKLFPERKLRLLQINDSNRYFPVASRKDAGEYKFNVAHTWYIHAEQPDKSGQLRSWCVEQVDASIRNKVLKTDTYASLLVPDGPSGAKYKHAYLNAEDMLSFLQQYVCIFEDQNMPQEAEVEALSSPPTYQESFNPKYENITTPPLRPAISERKRTFEVTEETCGTAVADEFMTICDKVMQNVNQAVFHRQELAGLAMDKDSVKKSKTNLACDSVRNMTSVLLAANKFLYTVSKEF